MKRKQSEGRTPTLTHTHMQASAKCTVTSSKRNGAAEHFLIIMEQPAVLARAREEGRQGESMSLT